MRYFEGDHPSFSPPGLRYRSGRLLCGPPDHPPVGALATQGRPLRPEHPPDVLSGYLGTDDRTPDGAAKHRFD